ncbi:EAL domain-containing protein [uncultured Neptuniibacter sp.]|uniref:EAL domain-containing protein n=1 Tax=uncultured Neptuniibacter sp. TaxID=502143 RepID=UPI002634AAAC|nr:EAL domain-containing protein [uncultured Neptuniibacter sp.]
MRQFSYSSAILTVVFTALISAAGILLFLAHQGSQMALQEEIRLTHSKDAHLLQRMVIEYQSGIERISHEIASRNDIRSSLLAADFMTAGMVLGESLLSNTGQQIDAMVLTTAEHAPLLIKGAALHSLELPLDQKIDNSPTQHGWTTVAVNHQGQTYHFLRLKNPVISPNLGEVIGFIYAFVLLNDNFWLLSESLEISGATAVAIMSDTQRIGAIIPTQLDTEQLTGTDLSNPIAPIANGTRQIHQIQIGDQLFNIHLFKPGNSNQLLADTYNQNLWQGALIVSIIAIAAMLLIRAMTNRSLGRLTHYAEQAPHAPSTPQYPQDCFLEFNRLGNQIESMLLDIRAHEKQIDAIFNHTPSAMFLKTLGLRYAMVNERFSEIFRHGETVIGKDDFEVFPEEEAQFIRETDRYIISSRSAEQSQYTLTTRQGKRTFLSSKFPLINDQGELYGIGGITTDITDKVQAEQEAQITQMVFEAAAEAIVIMHPEGEVITNSSFTRITGYDAHTARSFAFSLLSDHPDIEHALKSKGFWQGERIKRRANGEPLPIWLSVSMIQEDSGSNRYVAVFSDISKLKEAEHKLQKLAHFDNLTSLPNRTLFYDRLESALNRSERLEKQTALLFVDIDHFKHVNDTYGHQAGDQLLVEIAQRITANIRPEDTVCRLGGDEFTVILSDLENTDRIAEISRRIQSAINTPVSLGNTEIFTSASIGIAIYPDDGSNAELLLKHADTAMYHVKEQGRNDLLFFDKKLNAIAEARIQLEDELKRAINTEQLFLVYQPRFHISGELILSAEALLRWNHPTKGMIPPTEFIPIAESSGLILELGRRVLLQACLACSNWNKHSDQPVSVSVNLSARQLHDHGLLNDIREALAQSELPPSLLELEITETMVIKDMETVITRLEAIRALGVQLSVDDFGTGYSSLIYLKRLPVSTVKIDKSFIDDIPGTSDSENLIKAVISMSHSLNLNVVAEGVESHSQLSFLKEHQCNEIQGYLLAKPDSAARLQQLITSHEQMTH